MNRTPLLTKPSQTHLLSPQNDFDWLGNRELVAPAPECLPATAHSFFAPMHYESGYAYPLIVWMHSADSNEEELHKLMPLVSTRNHVAVAPRGTQASRTVRNGYNWGQSASELAEATERAQHCIELAKQRFNVHPERIFIAGQAAGGTLAYRIGMQNPELFAGAISLGGSVPRGASPFRNINQARQLPVLLSVSPDAEGYSLENVMDDMRLLRYAGISLDLRLHPAGDELTTTMLADVNNWVMESFCPASSATSS